MFCEKCGLNIPDNIKFCPKCGNRILKNGTAGGIKKAIWGLLCTVCCIAAMIAIIKNESKIEEILKSQEPGQTDNFDIKSEESVDKKVETNVFSYRALDYVTLGDYSNLTVEVGKQDGTVDDAFMPDNFGVATLEELINKSGKTLETDAKNNAQINEIGSAVLKVGEVYSFPEGLAETLEGAQISYYKWYAEQNNISMKELADSYYNLSEEELLFKIKESVQQSIKRQLILEAVAEQEKLDNSGFEQCFSELINSGEGYSEKEYYEMYGMDEKTGRQYMEKLYLAQLALNYLTEHAEISYTYADASGDAENEEVFNGEYTNENVYGQYTDNGILEDYDICGTYIGLGSICGVTINIYSSYDSEYVGNVNGMMESFENPDMNYSVDGEIKKVTDNVYRLETQYGTVYYFCAYKNEGEILIDVYINGDVFATLTMKEHFGMP